MRVPNSKITKKRKDQDDDAMIDVTAEVQKLRLHYDQLVKTKEQKKEQMRKNAETPSKRSNDLYEMGKTKLLYERAALEAGEQQSQEHMSTHSSSDGSDFRYPTPKTRSMSPNPICICDRLYDKGMAKVMAEKMVQEERREKEEARCGSSTLRVRNPSPIPICDRLYEQGMTKVMSGKMAELKKWEERQEIENRNDDPSPIPVCDRLYKEGMNKKLLMAEYDESQRKSRNNVLLPRSHYAREKNRPNTC